MALKALTPGIAEGLMLILMPYKEESTAAPR